MLIENAGDRACILMESNSLSQASFQTFTRHRKAPQYLDLIELAEGAG